MHCVARVRGYRMTPESPRDSHVVMRCEHLCFGRADGRAVRTDVQCGQASIHPGLWNHKPGGWLLRVY